MFELLRQDPKEVLNKARLQYFAWIPWNIEQPHHRELCNVGRCRTKWGCCNVSCTHFQYKVHTQAKQNSTARHWLAMSVQSSILQDENKTTVTHSWQAWPKLILYCKPVGGGNQAAMAGFHPAHMYTILCAPPKAELQQWSNVFYTNSASVPVQGLAGAGEEAEEEAREETRYKVLRIPMAIPGICSIIHLKCSSCLLMTKPSNTPVCALFPGFLTTQFLIVCGVQKWSCDFFLKCTLIPNCPFW